MKRRLLLAVSMAVALTSATLAAGPHQGTAQGAVQPMATGTGGAVATADHLATEAAIGILRRGGNAFDAAVAGAAVLGVTEPYSCGIGGGGFLVGWLADEGRAVTIDHREVAPAAVTEDALIDPDTGQPYPYEERVTSGLSVGVPGTVAGWAEILAGHGTMGLDEVLAPAVRGGPRPASRSTRTSTTRPPRTGTASTTSPPPGRCSWAPAGQPHPVGTVLRNPDLAGVLETLAAAARPPSTAAIWRPASSRRCGIRRCGRAPPAMSGPAG